MNKLEKIKLLMDIQYGKLTKQDLLIESYDYVIRIDGFFFIPDGIGFKKIDLDYRKINRPVIVLKNMNEAKQLNNIISNL